MKNFKFSMGPFPTLGILRRVYARGELHSHILIPYAVCVRLIAWHQLIYAKLYSPRISHLTAYMSRQSINQPINSASSVALEVSYDIQRLFGSSFTRTSLLRAGDKLSSIFSKLFYISLSQNASFETHFQQIRISCAVLVDYQPQKLSAN